MNLSLGICFSPIQSNLANVSIKHKPLPYTTKIYGKSVFEVNFSTRLIGNIVTPPFNFIANYVLDEYGLKPGVSLLFPIQSYSLLKVLFGNVASLAGLWISVLAKQSFYSLLGGQVVASIGHAFLLGAPQKISLTWFAPNEVRL